MHSLQSRWLAVASGLLLGLSSATDIFGLDFDWDSITPSSDLSYTPCYDKFGLQCARLLVPLDWQNASNPHNVSIAIAKLPAKVPDDDPKFGGTIFTNPGGPGGSGIGTILTGGRTLQNMLSGRKEYEILSWDPRGVGLTSPKADCFAGDIAAREVADVQAAAIGPLDASDAAFRRHLAGYKGLGQLCQETMTEGSILPYLSTASVVRDMVEMLDQVHALRNRNSSHPHVAPAASHRVDEKVIELKRGESADVPRIQYWGFSYGSLLGNAFASMYPGRVGRVIIDGVVDADDYIKGTWLTNLQDTDAIVDRFYKTCFEQDAACSLKRPSDNKWQDIRQRVDDFIAQTNQQPIPILTNHTLTTITGDDILGAFKGPVYSPLYGFKPLAGLLNDTLEGNYTMILFNTILGTPHLHDHCAPLNKTKTLLQRPGGDATHAIKCGDGEDETKHDIAHFQSYLTELKSQSQTLGALWATIRLSCSGWTIRPKWRFTGPFTTPEHDSSLVEGKPAAPLLFLSTRLDPVTPLRNAVNMAKNHPGAAVVIQENTGHCSLSAPSKCTRTIIQDYLEHGKMPENGTICEPDCDPWNECGREPKTMMMNLLSEEVGSRYRKWLFV